MKFLEKILSGSQYGYMVRQETQKLLSDASNLIKISPCNHNEVVLYKKLAISIVNLEKNKTLRAAKTVSLLSEETDTEEKKMEHDALLGRLNRTEKKLLEKFDKRSDKEELFQAVVNLQKARKTLSTTEMGKSTLTEMKKLSNEMVLKPPKILR